MASPTSLFASVLLIALLGLAGCGSSQPELQTPLLGPYRAADGVMVVFRDDGRFLAANADPGTFTVDGSAVNYTLGNGERRVGERLSNDVVTITNGEATLTFYRVGSTAAQSEKARTPSAPSALVRTSQDSPAPGVRNTPSVAGATSGAAHPAPDRTTPRDEYVLLPDSDSLGPLAAAFSRRPLTDSDLEAFIPEVREARDAFAKRDAMALHLPKFKERMEELRKQRYFKMRADTQSQPRSHRGPRAPGWTLTAAAWGGVSLGPYDFDHKGFPIPCLDEAGLMTEQLEQIMFEKASRNNAPCIFPVSDEETARTLEGMRSKSQRNASIALRQSVQ